MDDTTVIKGWVEGELKKMEEVLRNEYTSELRLLRHQMDKVWDENLLVPELIGDNELCLYRNLKEFCEAQKREFYQFRDDFEPTTARMIGEKVISVKNPLTIKINDLKKELADLKKEVAQSNAEVAATVAAERQYVETSLGEVIPQLEAQVAALKEQVAQHSALPSKVDKASEELELVRQALFQRMTSLDTAIGGKMTELREDILEQVNKTQEELDAKLNDVERKSMSFARRTASRQAEDSSKSQMKEAMQKKMKAKYGGLLAKAKGASAGSAMQQSMSAPSQQSGKVSSQVMTPREPEAQDNEGRAASNAELAEEAQKAEGRIVDVDVLQKKLMETFRVNARQFFLMKRDLSQQRKREHGGAASPDGKPTGRKTSSTHGEDAPTTHKRQQNLLQEAASAGASPQRTDTDGDRRALDVSAANVTAGPETDLTQEKVDGAAAQEPPTEGLRLHSGLGMVKEKTERSATAEAGTVAPGSAAVTPAAAEQRSTEMLP